MAVVSNGTTIIDAGALGSGVATGKMILIKTLTASNSANLTFHDGTDSVVFDDTYDQYIFKFIDIHVEENGRFLQFQANAVGASGFNETVTSTAFEAYHAEDNSSAGLGYSAAGDEAQGTGLLHLNNGSTDNDNDSCLVGTLRIFNPSSTTFVKHFIVETNNVITAQSDHSFFSGYFNTTTAIDEVKFECNSGNFNGIIKLYGIGG